MKSLKYLLPLLFVFVSVSAFAEDEGPDDLSQYIYGLDDMEAQSVVYHGASIHIISDPIYNKAIGIYGIPKKITDPEILQDFAAPQLTPDYTFVLFDSDEERTVYSVLFKGKIIDGSNVTIQKTDAVSNAVALRLPKQNLVPIQFSEVKTNEPVAFPVTLVEGLLTEYQSKPVSGANKIQFPKITGIPPRLEKKTHGIRSPTAALVRIPLPLGTFPDQIKPDSKGHIWFSQPSNNIITRYDPARNSWFHKEVGGLPDGLFVDSLDRVWFGEYGNQGMGMYNPATDTYKSYAVPYSKSRPAIPYETSDHHIWLADHEANKISEFDPEHEKFLHSFDGPTARGWIVDLVESPLNPDIIFFTEVFANKIGRFDKRTSTFSEYSLGTNGNPAFFVVDGKYLWVSLWVKSAFIRLNTQSGEVVEYDLTSDVGRPGGFGPIGRTSDGKIVLGNLSDSHVYLFNPATERTVYVAGVGKLKDGLTVTPKNEIWVSETKSAIYRIHF